MTSSSKMKTDPIRLNSTLAKAKEGNVLSKKDITFLLSLEDNEQIDRLFQAAWDLRSKHFGDTIFLYGFIYTSTYCRNDCHFCFYRSPAERDFRFATTSCGELNPVDFASLLK